MITPSESGGDVDLELDKELSKRFPRSIEEVGSSSDTRDVLSPAVACTSNGITASVSYDCIARYPPLEEFETAWKDELIGWGTWLGVQWDASSPGIGSPNNPFRRANHIASSSEPGASSSIDENSFGRRWAPRSLSDYDGSQERTEDASFRHGNGHTEANGSDVRIAGSLYPTATCIAQAPLTGLSPPAAEATIISTSVADDPVRMTSFIATSEKQTADEHMRTDSEAAVQDRGAPDKLEDIVRGSREKRDRQMWISIFNDALNELWTGGTAQNGNTSVLYATDRLGYLTPEKRPLGMQSDAEAIEDCNQYQIGYLQNIPICVDSVSAAPTRTKALWVPTELEETVASPDSAAPSTGSNHSQNGRSLAARLGAIGQRVVDHGPRMISNIRLGADDTSDTSAVKYHTRSSTGWSAVGAATAFTAGALLAYLASQWFGGNNDDET